MPVTIMTWDDDYSVDIQEIDEQHKTLLDLINKLYAALTLKQNRTQVEEILDELLEYTRVHFAVEECLLRLFDYEDYENHKRIHDSIVERVNNFSIQFKAGSDKVGMELLLFLKEWLIDHIHKEDKRYSVHLTKHGVKRKWLKKFW